MITAGDRDPFELGIQALEQRLAAARKVREIHVQFPGLLRELGFEFSHNGHGNFDLDVARLADAGSALSNYERIRDYFLNHGNPWTEAPQVGRILGLTRGTVATVFWTTHRERFEQAPVEGSKKKKKWRLRLEVVR